MFWSSDCNWSIFQHFRPQTPCRGHGRPQHSLHHDRQAGDGEAPDQEVVLLRLVPRGQGVQGTEGRGVHQPRGKAPDREGAPANSHQSDAPAEQQRTEDHPECVRKKTA